MTHLNRRRFLQSGTLAATLGLTPNLVTPAGASSLAMDQVHFVHDGLMIEPAEYANLLVRLCKEKDVETDIYLSGGSVQRLEETFAKLLGKESAVFVPTGTLANHLALRILCAGKPRALVQQESHIYCDSADCVQTLSHLNLVPVAPQRATVTFHEIEDAIKQAAAGAFPVPVGAIAIESPVRRRLGEVFDFEEMKKISAFARKQGIGMHLDGARLFLASAYTGITPAEYAAQFDTVYVSLYKYFNAASGAVLVGPNRVVSQVRHWRKVFGSGLLHGWPYTVVALHFLDGFAERFQKAMATARELFAALEKQSGFRVESIPHGSNIVRLHLPEIDIGRYVAQLQKQGILVRPAEKGSRSLLLSVNESLTRRSAEELARAFRAALMAA